jgi:hypothetical protein
MSSARTTLTISDVERRESKLSKSLLAQVLKDMAPAPQLLARLRDTPGYEQVLEVHNGHFQPVPNTVQLTLRFKPAQPGTEDR